MQTFAHQKVRFLLLKCADYAKKSYFCILNSNNINNN